jgi:DNA recombination protein RmuC
MLIAAMLIGLAAGAAGAWLALRSRLARGEQAALVLQRREVELATAVAELAVERRLADDQLAHAAKALSADALKENNAAFLALAETKLAGYVNPLKESLEKVDGHVQHLEQARERSFGALSKEVALLGDRTTRLANALRAPHERGRWGEVQLRRVVELAGMLEHCDFVAQVSVRDGEGALLRPDLVVKLPGGKHVVVDAKVPADAYFDAYATEDDGHRGALLADHARQVRDHVGKLAAKAYWRQFAPAPDFVVMFLPDETFLRVAHDHDARLSEDAWQANVILASPATLVTLLRTVAATWQQETVAESAREVHALGQELYDRLSTLAAHFGAVGRSLTSAVSNYNKTVGTLETRVLVTGRKLQQHGMVGDLTELEPVDLQPRALQAPELVESRDDLPRPLPAADAA